MKNAVDFHSEISETFNAKYKNHKDFQERTQVWTDIFKRYLECDNSVLDAGCGSGVFSKILSDSGYSVTSLDGSDKMLEICKKNTGNKLVYKLENIPFEKLQDVSLKDVIISSSVLEYIDDIEAAILGYRINLKKGGIMILSMPNKNSIFRVLEKIFFKIFKRPTYYQFVKHIEDSSKFNLFVEKLGFKHLESEYYGKNNKVSSLSSFLGKKYSNTLFISVFRKT